MASHNLPHENSVFKSNFNVSPNDSIWMNKKKQHTNRTVQRGMRYEIYTKIYEWRAIESNRRNPTEWTKHTWFAVWNVYIYSIFSNPCFVLWMPNKNAIIFFDMLSCSSYNCKQIRKKGHTHKNELCLLKDYWRFLCVLHLFIYHKWVF